MTHNDEQELLRLTSILESLDDRLDHDPECKEAVRKGALALSVSFIHGLRSEVEKLYSTLGKPLPKTQREHLSELGLEADSDDDG